MTKYTRIPHYSCEQGSCAEEVSYPAGELKEHKGQLWCENCWDYDNPMNLNDAEPVLDWSDLGPFVPDHISQAGKKVTRFEVIDHSDVEADRCLVRHGVDVELSYQDDGQTLKVFLKDEEGE